MKLKFKRKPEDVKKIVFGIKYKHVKPYRKIIPKSVCIRYKINAKKPVKRYWGDSDKDGVINGLDCEPRNKKKQGPQHEDENKMNDKQFERNKYRVLNQIEEMLGEPLTPQLVKCSWKQVADRNEKGEGTTFRSRFRSDLDCFDCHGYDTKCKRYME